MLQPRPPARHMGRHARNRQRHLGTLATSMKIALALTVTAAASTAMAESPIKAKPPSGSRGYAMVVAPAQRAFLEASLPHLIAECYELLLQHYYTQSLVRT